MVRDDLGPIEAYGDDRRQSQISRPGSHEGSMVRVAFVCVENAGRSQMAAAFARARAPAWVEVISGGTVPAAEVNRVVIDAMREVGIDLSGQKPARIGPAELADCDVVVTMGCSAEDVCPVNFRGDARDWALPDPKGRTLADVRRIRDEIENRVADLMQELALPSGRREDARKRLGR